MAILTVFAAGTAAVLTPAPLVSRRGVSIAAASASLLPSPLPLHTALAAPPRTLTDRSGNYVVDIQKAAAGLEDPLAEPEGAFSTISAALAVAPAGSTVLVRAGTYTERVFVTRPGIQLLAEPGAVVAWRSDKPYEAALTVDLSEAASGGSVTISGLTVRHSSPSIAQNYAVYVPPPSRAASATKVELRDLDVSSSSGSGLGVEGGDVTLLSSKVHDCRNHGLVFLGPTARGAVRGCELAKNKLNGVLLRDGASPAIEGSRLVNNGAYGASLIDCRGSLAAGNEIRGNGKGGVSGECDDGDDAEV